MLSRRLLLASSAVLALGCGRDKPPVSQPVLLNVAAYIGFATVRRWGACDEGAYEGVAATLTRDTEGPFGPTRGGYRLELKFLKEYFPDSDTHTPADAALDRVAALLDDLDVDLVTVWPELARWLGQRGLLLPLNQLRGVDGDALEREFFPVALDRYRAGGNLYALPVSAAPLMLNYHERHFRDQGVPPVDATWDWDDLARNAARLTTHKQDGTVARWGLVAHDRDIWWALWQNGAEALDPDTLACRLQEPAAVEALQFVHDLIHKQRVSPPETDADLWNEYGHNTPAMSFDYSYFRRDPAHYRLAALPRGKALAVPVADGFGVGIAARTPRTEAALAALQGFVAAWQDEVLVPAKREAVSSDRGVHPSLLGAELTAVERSLEHGRAVPNDLPSRVALNVAVRSIAAGDAVASAVNRGCAAVDEYSRIQENLSDVPLHPNPWVICEGTR